MFHRIPFDAVAELDAPRYFSLAMYLHAYGGAVTAVLAHRAQQQASPAAGTVPVVDESHIPGLPPGAQVVRLDPHDRSTAAAMTRNGRGFPTVGYKGRG